MPEFWLKITVCCLLIITTQQLLIELNFRICIVNTNYLKYYRFLFMININNTCIIAFVTNIFKCNNHN